MNKYCCTSCFRSMWACLWESCCIALVMSVGDLLAQRCSGAKDLKSIKWMRTVKYASIGLCFIGPVMKCWFNIMHPWFQNQQNYRFADFKQVVNDQLYLPPMLNLGLVFLSNLSKSNSPEEMEKGIRDKYISIMKSHYAFWPGVQILGAFVVKPNARLLFANIMAIWWFTYVSIELNEGSKTYTKA